MSLQGPGRGLGICWDWKSAAQLPAPVTKGTEAKETPGLPKHPQHCHSSSPARYPNQPGFSSLLDLKTQSKKRDIV